MNAMTWFLDNWLWIAAAAVAAFLLVAFYRYVLAILAVLVVVAVWLFVQRDLEKDEKQRASATVNIMASFSVEACLKDRPLLVRIRNDGPRPVEKVTWHIAANAYPVDSTAPYM